MIVFMTIIVILENIIENIIANRSFLQKKYLSHECNMVTISKFDTQRMLNNDHLMVLISYDIVKGHSTTWKTKIVGEGTKVL